MISYYIKGDLLKAFQENKFDAIVHGCNCFHLMGAGIAKSIASTFPDAYASDKKSDYGSWEKLGTYTKASTLHGEIINAYTQYRPGKCIPDYLYENISDVFSLINSYYAGKTIGIPKIGAGIAGGNWEVIAKIIQEKTPDVKIVVYYI